MSPWTVATTDPCPVPRYQLLSCNSLCADSFLVIHVLGRCEHATRHVKDKARSGGLDRARK